MQAIVNSLVSTLPCTICHGKMFFIRRTLCESGHEKVESFYGMTRKAAIDYILSIVPVDKSEADAFVDLLISAGVNIDGSGSKVNTLDNGLVTEPIDSDNE